MGVILTTYKSWDDIGRFGWYNASEFAETQRANIADTLVFIIR